MKQRKEKDFEELKFCAMAAMASSSSSSSSSHKLPTCSSSFFCKNQTLASPPTYHISSSVLFLVFIFLFFTLVSLPLQSLLCLINLHEDQVKYSIDHVNQNHVRDEKLYSIAHHNHITQKKLVDPPIKVITLDPTIQYKAWHDSRFNESLNHSNKKPTTSGSSNHHGNKKPTTSGSSKHHGSIMIDPAPEQPSLNSTGAERHHSRFNESLSHGNKKPTTSGSSKHHGSIKIDPVPKQPSVNSTSAERRRWIRENWNRLEILHSDLARGNFSERIEAFLAGLDGENADQNPKSSVPSFQNQDATYHNDLNMNHHHHHHHQHQHHSAGPCKMRFFMTWISGLGSFGARERLGLESVFKSHPDACLVILSRTFDSPAGAEILGPFARAGFRVAAIAPDLSSLSSSTPTPVASKWLESLHRGRIDPGHISLGQNLSNLLRLLVLHKYGGTYLDTDVVVTRSFGTLDANTIGAQNADKDTRAWTRLNNAVMVFEKNNPLLARFIADFCSAFNGSKWGHNGPYLVTRVVLSSRKRYSHAELTSHCKVLKPIAFYPVDWDHITSFFRAPVDELEARWVSTKLLQLKRSSYAVHLWNKMSRDIDIDPGSIMDSIFRQVCVFCDNTTLHNALKGIKSS